MSDFISKYKRGSSVGSRSALYIEADWLGLNSALCETAVTRAVGSGANEGRHSSAEVGGIPHWSLSFHIQFICTKTTCWEELTRPCHYKKQRKLFKNKSSRDDSRKRERRGIKVGTLAFQMAACFGKVRIFQVTPKERESLQQREKHEARNLKAALGPEKKKPQDTPVIALSLPLPFLGPN